MPSAARSLNPFRVLARHPNFRIFWLGQTTSLVGTWMQTMAQGWLALELSNNAFLVGLVSAIGSLPILLFTLQAGVLVDRTNRLQLVKIMQTLMLIEAAVLWLMTVSGRVTIGWLLFLSFLGGVFSAVEIPARQSLFAELVGREDLGEAIALNSSGFNLARIIGPTVAAVVIRTAGIGWCFGGNALSYLAVLLSLFLIQLPPREPVVEGSPLEGLREGLRFMVRTRDVWALMRLVTVYSILGVPFLTLMPVLARDLLGLGADGYGVLLSMVGIGGLFGALFVAASATRFGRGRLLMAASIAWPLLLVLLSVERSAALARPTLLVIGFSMIVSGALTNGILQSMVPDELRGRLMAAYGLVVVGLAQVVGSFAAGAVARVIGVTWAIGGGGLAMLVYLGFAYREHPALTRL